MTLFFGETDLKMLQCGHNTIFIFLIFMALLRFIVDSHCPLSTKRFYRLYLLGCGV